MQIPSLLVGEKKTMLSLLLVGERRMENGFLFVLSRIYPEHCCLKKDGGQLSKNRDEMTGERSGGRISLRPQSGTALRRRQFNTCLLAA